MKKLTAIAGSSLLLLACSPAEKVSYFNQPENETYVINGTPAEHAQFPSIVAMIDLYGSQRCSGTLIRPDLVLTAAHCIPPSPSVINIVYGSSDIYQPCDNCLHSVAEAVAHEEYDYNKAYGQNDIGWVLLDKPIEDAVTAEVLPESLFSSALHVDDIVKIVGYGVNSGWTSGRLFYGEAPITKFFKDGMPTNDSAELIEEMVAGLDNPNTPNLCYGDSGGPTYLEYKESVFVTGVTSRVPPDVPVECGHGAVVGLPGHYEELTNQKYEELKKCRDEGGCYGSGGSGGIEAGGSGGSGVSGAGGSSNGAGGNVEVPVSDEFFVVSDDGCSCSGGKNKNSDLGFLVGAAVIACIARRKRNW